MFFESRNGRRLKSVRSPRGLLGFLPYLREEALGKMNSMHERAP